MITIRSRRLIVETKKKKRDLKRSLVGLAPESESKPTIKETEVTPEITIKGEMITIDQIETIEIGQDQEIETTEDTITIIRIVENSTMMKEKHKTVITMKKEEEKMRVEIERDSAPGQGLLTHQSLLLLSSLIE